MAHEVNHNLGSNDWGRHVGNPDEDEWWTNGGSDDDWGCGATGPDSAWPGTTDDLNQLYTDTLGWYPGLGLVQSDKNDLMSYCNEGNPRKWISDYRWEALADRLVNFESGHPEYPSSLFYQNEVQQAMQMSALVLDENSQFTRFVSGYIHEDGFGKLNPSYAIPGSFARLPERIDGLTPTHWLNVEFSNGSSKGYPLYPQFDLLGDGDHPQTGKSNFFYWLPDDGSITEISITVSWIPIKDEQGNNVTLRSTGWTTDGKLIIPTEIQTGKKMLVEWNIDLSKNVSTVYSQLQYSHDGRHWYNLGKMTTDTRVELSVSGLPGGDASFRLIVTNGLDSQIIEGTSSVSVARLPVQVKINRNIRFKDEGVLSLNQDDTPTVSLGSFVSLFADGFDPQTGGVSAEDLVWTVEMIDQASGIALQQLSTKIIGKFFNYQFTKIGTYRIKVSFKSSGSEFDTFVIKVLGSKFTSREDYNKFMEGLDVSVTTQKISSSSSAGLSHSFTWLIAIIASGTIRFDHKRRFA
jgi:hypothetical protein